MSVIRVGTIQSPSGTITLSGITTFSGTGSFSIPGGDLTQRPSSPVAGQIRYSSGEISGVYAVEYYNGSSWVTV
jgi:hypothetical protein